MVGMRHDSNIDALTKELLEKASDLWGQERADRMQAAMAQAAEYLHQVAENLPDREEEPAFFF